MKFARSAFAIASVLVATAVVSSSCSDSSPVAPPPPALHEGVSANLLGSLGGTLNNLLGLTACSPLPPATTTKTIGPAGGVIAVGPHELIIPAHALSHNVTITASIKSENVNRVHFEPDGLQFAVPATLTMSYANCSLTNSLLRQHRIVYVSPNLNILQQLLSLDDLLHRTVSAKLNHFSDYAVEDESFSDHAAWW